ncbi:hypothetical protein NDI49_09170 [Trichocoleus sp. ST-U3]|uniref:hypothetical protein n=1 Tax=Coleofasciculus sp. FACHB-542 TaxID=2692787 RepID=UPI001686907A|nr:hypothetical protein [Coleofasciculus sp. FACHB-542]MBD2086539.1 hypothetical protein [Coleofasciculus sp. FACHB-542]
MKQEKRLTGDVWGVQLHFKQVQKDNYCKAEGWRDRLHQLADGQASLKETSQPFSVCGLGF